VTTDGPKPPPVTIVDPNAPPGTADLLDHGRDPWRPSRRQAVVIAATVLTTAVVAGVTAQVRHSQHERALDAAAERAVLFFLDSTSAESDMGHQSLGLINEGPSAVRVLDVGFVGDGYGTQHLDAQVPTYDTLPLAVPLGTTCPTSLLDSAATELRVRARTHRGTVVTRVVGLDPREIELLGMAERARCGLLRVEEAVSVTGGTAALRGSRLVLTLVVENRGTLPVTLTSLTASEGMHAEATMPLRLPGRPPAGPTPTARLHVVLTVTSCEAVRANLFGDPVFGPDGNPLGPSALTASAANPYQRGDVLLDAEVNAHMPFDDNNFPEPVVPPLLARACPHTGGLA
jgi:hypothetical protein